MAKTKTAEWMREHPDDTPPPPVTDSMSALAARRWRRERGIELTAATRRKREREQAEREYDLERYRQAIAAKRARENGLGSP